jgi:hypothetical protein
MNFTILKHKKITRMILNISSIYIANNKDNSRIEASKIKLNNKKR